MRQASKAKHSSSISYSAAKKNTKQKFLRSSQRCAQLFLILIFGNEVYLSKSAKYPTRQDVAFAQANMYLISAKIQNLRSTAWAHHTEVCYS